MFAGLSQSSSKDLPCVRLIVQFSHVLLWQSDWAIFQVPPTNARTVCAHVKSINSTPVSRNKHLDRSREEVYWVYKNLYRTKRHEWQDFQFFQALILATSIDALMD